MNMNMSAEKLMSRMFRKVDSVVWDLMSGKLGIRTKDNEIATLDGNGEDASIVINPFEDFGFAIPAFAQSTPAADVKVGDLIYMSSGDSAGWITNIKTAEAGKTTFSIIRPSGTTTTWHPPKVQLFGLDGGVLVVRSLGNMLPGGQEGLAGLQGMMLPMLMMGGDMDMDSMLPMLLMSQMGGGAGAGMGGMMQAMMMAKMMGGSSKGTNSGGPCGSHTFSPFRGK